MDIGFKSLQSVEKRVYISFSVLMRFLGKFKKNMFSREISPKRLEMAQNASRKNQPHTFWSSRGPLEP